MAVAVAVLPVPEPVAVAVASVFMDKPLLAKEALELFAALAALAAKEEVPPHQADSSAAAEQVVALLGALEDQALFASSGDQTALSPQLTQGT